MQERRQEGDLDPGFVKLVFYSSVTVFARGGRDCVWRPRDTAPVESCLAILPRVLAESQLPWFARTFEANIRKSAEDSTWLVERDSSLDVYCERGLSPRWIAKLQRKRAREEAEARAEDCKRPRQQAPPAEPPVSTARSPRPAPAPRAAPAGGAGPGA